MVRVVVDAKIENVRNSGSILIIDVLGGPEHALRLSAAKFVKMIPPEVESNMFDAVVLPRYARDLCDKAKEFLKIGGTLFILV